MPFLFTLDNSDDIFTFALLAHHATPWLHGIMYVSRDFIYVGNSVQPSSRLTAVSELDNGVNEVFQRDIRLPNTFIFILFLILLDTSNVRNTIAPCV